MVLLGIEIWLSRLLVVFVREYFVIGGWVLWVGICCGIVGVVWFVLTFWVNVVVVWVIFLFIVDLLCVEVLLIGWVFFIWLGVVCIVLVSVIVVIVVFGEEIVRFFFFMIGFFRILWNNVGVCIVVEINDVGSIWDEVLLVLLVVFFIEEVIVVVVVVIWVFWRGLLSFVFVVFDDIVKIFEVVVVLRVVVIVFFGL